MSRPGKFVGNSDDAGITPMPTLSRKAAMRTTIGLENTIPSALHPAEVFLYLELHDSADQSVRDGLIEWQPDRALSTRIPCQLFLEPLLDGDRHRIEADVRFEGREVHHRA